MPRKYLILFLILLPAFVFAPHLLDAHSGREMVYRKLIQGAADPGMKVSGVRLLQIISKTLNYTGADGSVHGSVQ